EQTARAAAEGRGGPRLAGCCGRRVRARIAIAQHHLHHAKTIDHRDRRLKAALLAVSECRLSQLQGKCGRQRFVGYERFLRLQRAGIRANSKRQCPKADLCQFPHRHTLTFTNTTSHYDAWPRIGQWRMRMEALPAVIKV